MWATCNSSEVGLQAINGIAVVFFCFFSSAIISIAHRNLGKTTRLLFIPVNRPNLGGTVPLFPLLSHFLISHKVAKKDDSEKREYKF